jgi:hypothetical protein
MGTYIVNVTGQFPPRAAREQRAELIRHLKEFGACGDPTDAVPSSRGFRAHQGRWVLEAADVLMAISRASAAYKAAAGRSGLDLPVGVRVHVEGDRAGSAPAVGAPSGAPAFASPT